MEHACAGNISVSFAHLVYTCGDPLYYVLTAVWINPQLRLSNHKGTPSPSPLPPLLPLHPLFCLFLTYVPTSLWLHSYINCINKCNNLTYNHLNKFHLYYFDNRCVFHRLILNHKQGSFDPNLKRETFDQSKNLLNCDVTTI